MSEPVGNTPRSAIPGNSHKSREAAEAAKAESEPREKIEKVVEGKVVTRKKPWWKKATNNIVADDAQTVGDYILIDVVVPAVKNLILDIVSQGAERALFGTSRARRSNVIGGGRSGLKTQYNAISERPVRSLSREARASHDFDDIILETRAAAIDVIESLIVLVERYGRASVADLYDLVGVTGDFTDRRWGWDDLRTANVRQVRGGFLLDLPRPEHLR